ncbi:MAG: ATP-binding protein [Clostridia bacterium]|nr:ATP-binding protein [Clostridia bacterium]
MGKREISEIVSRRFEERRRDEELAARQRRAELHAKLPELAALDRERGTAAASLLGAVFQGQDGLEDRLDTIRARQQDLKKQRAELLIAAGYPADYDTAKPRCSKCADTGFVDGKMCPCMKREIVMEGYRESGMGKLLERQRFDNFDLSRYSDALLPGKSFSPRQAMESIYRDCLDWATDFSLSSPSLLLIGGTGLGKTHLSSAMAKAAIDKGFDVLYLSVPTALSRAEKERFDKEDETESVTRRMLEAELLILDDLGAESASALAPSLIYTVVNERAAVLGLPTIINTNLDPQHLERKYGAAVTSRLLGEFLVMHFVGSDLRLN